MMKTLAIAGTALLVAVPQVEAARNQMAAHHSFSRSLVIGVALVLLVQAGHHIYRRLLRGTRLAKLQRARRNRGDGLG